MGSPEKISEKDTKKPKNQTNANVLQKIPEIIHQNIQIVRDEIQKTSETMQLMIRGILAEIQEVKTLATSNKRLIEQFAGKQLIKKPTRTELTEITSGLDLLEKIPQHLRRTYEAVMKFDKGATARQISNETGKSRPLESDYLNQLNERGWIFRKRVGKEVLFYSKLEDITDEVNSTLNPNGSIDFVTSKKNQVKEASASSDKN